MPRIDAIDADIAAIDAEIEAHLAPFVSAAARLDDIPGIGPVAAAIIMAEIGTDMARFPTAGHLCPWAKLAPGINSSTSKIKGNGSTGHGNRYLARVPGKAAVGAARTDTFLGARYRRITKRRGKKRAIVAVGRSILIIIWHLLNDDTATYADLGADHYTRHTNPDTRTETTSESSKPSATRSPSNPQPYPTDPTLPAQTMGSPRYAVSSSFSD